MTNSPASPSAAHETAVRVIFLNDRDETLLQRVHLPDKPPFFITPGGRVDPGDATLRDAVLRELVEETGFSTDRIELRDSAAYVGTHRMIKRGSLVEMTEHFFTARLKGDYAIVAAKQSLTEEERVDHHGERWFTLNELRASTEIVLPVNLADLVVAILRGEPFPAVDFSDPPEFLR